MATSYFRLTCTNTALQYDLFQTLTAACGRIDLLQKMPLLMHQASLKLNFTSAPQLEVGY